MEFQIKRRRGRIEIVPMIDIMFFMLVFFMLFSTFDKAKASIEVELPKALNIGAARQDVVVIGIDRHSQLFFGKEPVNYDQLKQCVLAELQRNAETRFVVRPDARVPYGDLIRVTDLLAGAGVSKPLWGVDRGQMPNAEK